LTKNNGNKTKLDIILFLLLIEMLSGERDFDEDEEVNFVFEMVNS
jgi:hypothetical protein